MTLAALALAIALGAGAPPTVWVGSKSFTESVVLGELAAQLAASAGARVEHRAALGGTRVVWEALRRGDIDVYPDYTGTLWREILGEAPGDLAALRAALARHGIGATSSLGFEDTYAIGMRRDAAARLGVRRLSDLERFPHVRFGFTNEFLDRSDGWPALRARYRLPQQDVRGLDHDLAYRAIEEGAIDATDLYSTDAELRRGDLAVLEDDRHAFPEYLSLIHISEPTRPY